MIKNHKCLDNPNNLLNRMSTAVDNVPVGYVLNQCDSSALCNYVTVLIQVQYVTAFIFVNDEQINEFDSGNILFILESSLTD